VRLILTASLLLPLAGADLPVTRVIVYKNGVAYFERSGAVPAGEPARLEFRSGEMDDVLKSLVLEDRAGGKVQRLRYELAEPVQRKLAETPFQLQNQMALILLLDQWRGAKIEVKSGAALVTGLIVSGRLAALAQGEQLQELTLLTDAGELRTLDVGRAGSVRLLDAKLDQQLKDALGVLASARSREKRAVTVDAGTAARNLLVRYLTPAAVWKSSYRLVFPDTGDPVLEGWAIVDNASGEDWNNVELTVVSGKPVSFVTQLYEPKFLTRPRAELAAEGAVAPEVYAGAVTESADTEAGAPQRKMAAGRMALMSAPMAAPPPAPMALSAVVAAVQSRESGELFEYRFSTPVSARKGESAMIPFVQQAIAARRVYVYSDRSSPNPRSAAELTNNTGKTLDGGPLTIYQGASYAGEALMETLKATDKRLISFAVDLGTRITTNLDSSTEVVREIKALRGVLTRKTAVTTTTTYTIQNVDAREKTLIVEHPASSAKVVSPKPEESTGERHRFSVRLLPKGAQKLVVVEEDVNDESLMLSNATPDSLLIYLENKTLPAAGRKQLETIQARKNDLAAVDATLRRIESEMSEIVRDQERLRANLGSLNRVGGQQEMVQRYVAEMAKGDTQLAALRDRQAEARKRKAALEAEIADSIRNLQF
jgi:hypothetical protein